MYTTELKTAIKRVEKISDNWYDIVCDQLTKEQRDEYYNAWTELETLLKVLPGEVDD